MKIMQALPPMMPSYAQIQYLKQLSAYTYNTYGSRVNLQQLDSDCDSLRKAMKGAGTDEDLIISILTQRNNEQRYMLKQRYKAIYNRDLVQDLKTELHGHFEDAVIALLDSPYELDCRGLYHAMHRPGTDEEALIEILVTRPSYQLAQDKLLFQQLYGKDLVSYVHSETSGHFRKILEALLQCQRHDNSYPLNPQELQMEAHQLYQGGAARWGTNEDVFTRIFTTRSPAEIAYIAQAYKQMSGVDLYTSIKKEFSTSAEKALCAIFLASINTPEYFATRVRDSIKGIGTKDTNLIRVIVSRADYDLGLIKQAYRQLYNRDMVADVQSDTSGDYKKILTALMNKS
jgi:annexin A7/11